MKTKTRVAIVAGLLGLMTSIAAAAAPKAPCLGHVGDKELCTTPACTLGQTCCDC